MSRVKKIICGSFVAASLICCFSSSVNAEETPFPTDVPPTDVPPTDLPPTPTYTPPPPTYTAPPPTYTNTYTPPPTFTLPPTPPITPPPTPCFTCGCVADQECDGYGGAGSEAEACCNFGADALCEQNCDFGGQAGPCDGLTGVCESSCIAGGAAACENGDPIP